ncbi:MAG: hypothetical protein RLZZ210_565 [Pseudomonadota bacterium]|jgi:hypothetical protein
MPTLNDTNIRKRKTPITIDLTIDSDDEKQRKIKKAKTSTNLSASNSTTTSTLTSSSTFNVVTPTANPTFKIPRYNLNQFTDFSRQKLTETQTKHPNEKIYEKNNLHHTIPTVIERNTRINHQCIEVHKDEIVEELLTTALGMPIITENTQFKSKSEIIKLHKPVFDALKTKTAQEILEIFLPILQQDKDTFQPNSNTRLAFLTKQSNKFKGIISRGTPNLSDIQKLLYGSNNLLGISQFIQYQYKKIACIELMLNALKQFSAKEYKQIPLAHIYLITSQLLDKNIAGGIYYFIETNILSKIEDKQSEEYKTIHDFIKSKF